MDYFKNNKTKQIKAKQNKQIKTKHNNNKKKTTKKTKNKNKKQNKKPYKQTNKQINVGGYRRGNQKWTIQRNWQHRRRQTKQKHNTICVGRRYAQTKKKKQKQYP